ncbi:MAG TPA: S-layer homology domain-containing protein [Candidatus Ventrousia excrementavium]|uniref:S-layer homology domain-containing protein n=1 Tax=Candidatus Ventrousia excrementavium TaxID=2840961 RepID=A0A9D1IXJ7_9CLOT|nr:S-layer homology domain-containing protein [Candidatus Ventrousia excrementavium]
MKKWMSWMLVCALLYSLAAVPAAAADETAAASAETEETVSVTFEDVQGLECQEAVEALASMGIVGGYPDGTFRPEQTINRAEVAKMVVTALGYNDGGLAVYTGTLSDTAGHWAESLVAYAQKIGVIKGDTEGTFRPEDPVSYDEAVTFVVRALGYDDSALEGTWPENCVLLANELGIPTGEAGSEGATRGDVAVMLYTAMQLPIGGEGEDTMLARQSFVEETAENTIPYGRRLIFENGLGGAVEDSADDIQPSAYYQTPDYYTLGSTENRVMLTGFKTQQQSTGYTCGLTSAIMVLEWYGLRGDLNELDLVALRQNDEPGATTLRQMTYVFDGLEEKLGQQWDVFTTYDAGLTWDENGYPVVTVPDAGEMTLFEMFPYFLEQGKPVIIGWNDWGGHYQVVIGYDNMGTETTADDVVIIADPYDTTDHLQDGYTTLSAERFIWDYSVGFDPDFDYGVFVVASPEGYTYTPAEGSDVESDPDNVGVFDDSHVIVQEGLAEDIAAMAETAPYNGDYGIWMGSDGLSGPASSDVYRLADHDNSLYYKEIDAASLTSTDTLTMLEGYKSVQQATEYTCGLSSMVSVLEWFGQRGDLNEIDLAMLRDKTDGLPGATVQEMLNVISSLDGEWNVQSSYDLVETETDFGLGLELEDAVVDLGDVFSYYLEQGVPVMVLSHEWGGHWQVVIGYDDMGTEGTQDDVLILMDPYDTTDHNQDGYVIESYERLAFDWGNSYDADMPYAGFVVMQPAE